MRPEKLNTVSLAHAFLSEYVRSGDLCIDATMGRGNDTLFLCELVGEAGKVLAFDIQDEALESTKARLAEHGVTERATLIKQSHSEMTQYAELGTVSAIIFNFGYLPGGDHNLATVPETSITAIDAGLTLLKEGGVMCLCIYYGGDTGFSERDALLAHLKNIDPKRYTVLLTDFYNRPNCPPMPIFIWKRI